MPDATNNREIFSREIEAEIITTSKLPGRN
jgi:hypothetical protein